MFFDSFRRKWMLDVLTWFSLENNVFFEVFDEINGLFRFFSRRKERLFTKKSKKTQFSSRKERFLNGKSLFSRRKERLSMLMVPLWYPQKAKKVPQASKRAILFEKRATWDSEVALFSNKIAVF